MVSVIQVGGKYFLEGMLPQGKAQVTISAKDAQKIIQALSGGKGKGVKIKTGLVVDSPLMRDDCAKFVFTGKIKGFSCESKALIKKQLIKVK